MLSEFSYLGVGLKTKSRKSRKIFILQFFFSNFLKFAFVFLFLSFLLPEFVILLFNCYFHDFHGFRDFRFFNLAANGCFWSQNK